MSSAPYFPENLDDYAPWVGRHGLLAPYGECQCGCGQKTTIAPVSNKVRLGHLAGHPVRFVFGHINGASQSLSDAFWKYVTPGDSQLCWEWQGHRVASGYGHLSFGQATNKVKAAHRISWEIHYGPIPDGLWVLHKCDNRACCNPSHLFLGTAKDNFDDMLQKGRQGKDFGILRADDVREIRRLASEGESLRTLATTYGVLTGHIRRIVKGDRWGGVK